MRKVHALRNKVESAAMERYRIEGLGAEAPPPGKARSSGARGSAGAKHPGAAAAGKGAGDDGEQKEAELKKAMARYNFYLCVKCDRPYFGGTCLPACLLA